MNQENIEELLNNINISTEAIIANQTNNFSYNYLMHKQKKIDIYNFNERGVGLNRNNALMRANADIVLFADDDIEYRDGYEQIILDEFRNNPKADMIFFNLCNNDDLRTRYMIKKCRRVHRYNCLRYGAVRIAVKLDKIKENNIFFSLLFGGGAKYGSGEDSIFIYDCIKSGLKAYSSPKEILTLKESESTWFKGYNEKYFYDKGALLRCIFGKKARIVIFLFILKHYKNMIKVGINKAYRQMIKGYKEFSSK